MSLFSHHLCLYLTSSVSLSHIFCVFISTSSVFGFCCTRMCVRQKSVQSYNLFFIPANKNSFFRAIPCFFSGTQVSCLRSKASPRKKSNFSSLCSQSISFRYVRGASAPCFEYRLPAGYAGILPAVKSLSAQKKVISLRYVRVAFLFVMFAELQLRVLSIDCPPGFLFVMFSELQLRVLCINSPPGTQASCLR